MIEYKPDKDNIAADSLSRMFALSWSKPKTQFMQKLLVEVQSNVKLRELIAQCQNEPQLRPHYTTKGGLLCWKNRLVIPKGSELIQVILTENHSSPIGGHSGNARTVARIFYKYFWHNMKRDIEEFVQHCAICQQVKNSHTLPAGLLQPLPIPSQVWEDVAMDFITGLPPSFGYTVIMVVIDRLTKYAHFTPLKSDYNSKGVA